MIFQITLTYTYRYLIHFEDTQSFLKHRHFSNILLHNQRVSKFFYIIKNTFLVYYNRS